LEHNKRYTSQLTRALRVRLAHPAKGALIYSILQGLASLEARYFARRDFDRLARTGIAAGACGTRLDDECAEPEQRNRVAGFERRRDGVEHGIHGTRRVRLLQARLSAHRVDQFGFVHIRFLGFLCVAPASAAGARYSSEPEKG